MATSRRVAEQHQDWLSLTDAEEPWFSLPALKRTLANGLDRAPSEVRAEHKVRWYGDEDTPSARLAEDRTDYIDWLLREVLEWGDDYLAGERLPPEFQPGVTRQDVTVVPTGVYRPAEIEPVGLFEKDIFDSDPNGSEGNETRVLVFTLPAGTDPKARASGDGWSAAWVQRAALSCRHHHIPLALVTDGDHLTLVHAPEKGITGWGTWRASEFATEPVLLDSFWSMLRSWRFTAAAQRNIPESLLEESASSQAEVTNQLGMQVRQATELLVNAISRANQSRQGTLLSGIEPHEVYEAAVTVMMRMVFLLVAEENDLLPIDDRLYQELYSIRTLREALEEEHFQNPEALEARTTAWHRLLATSRAVHSGIHHNELSIPAYGGSLFDPDRFPFLEGRPANSSWHATPGTPIWVTDQDTLAILDALLVLRSPQRGKVSDTRRLSYRNVNVEQIGHIYERLLDHDAVTAEHDVLGLVGKPGREPEIGLPELENKRMESSTALVEWLSHKDQGVGTPTQIRNLLAKPVDQHVRLRLREACQDNPDLAARIEPFTNLLRLDLRGRPLVFLRGAVYVTETGSRRDSGTAYTTRELAEEVVEHTLAPLCYSPGPRDTPDTTEWRIRTSADILDLKVCDPAIGSGAILVAACRYLADRLIEAWQEENHPLAADTATAADDPSRLDVVVEARRQIAEHCCYGVDRNPMAVEMAKLSMWLTTVAKDRPFTFLDHAIKTGDSLLGIQNLDQLRHLHFDVAEGKSRETPIPGFSTGGDAVKAVQKLLDQALKLREEMGAIESNRPSDIQRKQDLHRRSEAALAILSTVADVLSGAALVTAHNTIPKEALTTQIETDARVIVQLIEALGTPEQANAMSHAQDRARMRLDSGRPDNAPSREPLHWPIAFPEVFSTPGRTPGFDAMVGNPPFIGGQKITGAAGTDYRNHIIAWIGNGTKGSADLVAYFFLNATRISQSFGYLATNTLAQGATSKVGLAQIVDSGWTICRAVSSTHWPGKATVKIVKVWITANPWSGQRILDGQPEAGIDEMLRPGSRSGWRKRRLLANVGKSFQGSIALGDSFIVTPQEANDLIAKDRANADVLYPYLTGDDLNHEPTLQAPRWIINFSNWSEERARNYPDCFEIVRGRTKPERMKGSDAAVVKWWRLLRPRPNLYRTIAPLERVMAMARHSKPMLPVFVPTGQVLSEATVVLAYDDDFHFGLFTSGFHYRWTLRYGSSLGEGPRYTTSDVFDTFPQPPHSSAIEAAGKALDFHRSALMKERDLGLTDLYNLVHEPDEVTDGPIRELRDMHVKLDYAVRDAYGWFDLDLEHGFCEVDQQGIRFTFSPPVADEILERLLELNKERYENEVAKGLHDRKKTKTSKRAAEKQGSLLEKVK